MIPTALTEITHRKDLPTALTKLGLSGFGAEIGVSEGAYSHRILEHSNLCHLFSIDRWEAYDSAGTMIKETPEQLKYIQACCKLAPFRTRVSFIRMASLDAAKIFQNDFFDFIYIDADHSYTMIRQDLEAWWPKLKSGGVFAGHDYWPERPEGTKYHINNGVQEAVDEFNTKHQLILHTTIDHHNQNGSWITQKPL